MTTSLLYTDPLEAVCTRYSLPVAPIDTLAMRLLQHLAQMERDAAEAHSAAKALGVEVKDLADQATLLRKATAGVSMEGIALQSSEAILKTIRMLTAAPGATDIIDHVREVVRQRDLAQAKLEIALRVIVDALPPGHRGTEPITTEHAHKVADLVRAFVRLHEDAMVLWEGEIVDARKVLNHSGPYVPLATLIRDLQADRDRMVPTAATLQAINEALPADLRHTDDLAAAVRTLAERDDEVVPAIQTVAALRHALESPHLCLALARELYDADDNLLALLEDAHRPSLAETLMATLATSRAPRTEYPPLPKPSALARTLEGPACVAYYGHLTRPGRIEAIGDDLLRFHPVEGNAVTLNATRRDLEVYHLTADELATEIARAESRKAPPAETPPTPRSPDVADDDIPF